MNKIRIATNDMALTVKMSDEQANVWFGTLTRALLGEYPDIAEPVEVEEPEAEDSEPETEEQPSDPDEDEPEPVEEPTPQESYKGFLRITCAHCGETGSFNARYPIGFYRCKSCGENNALHDLHRLNSAVSAAIHGSTIRTQRSASSSRTALRAVCPCRQSRTKTGIIPRCNSFELL